VPEEKMTDYLKQHAADWLHDKADLFIEAGQKHNIKPEVIICIANADSSLGRELKTAYNIGNVGNNDRGDTREMFTAWEGIEAIAITLNNRFLGHYTTIGQLSRGGGNKTGSIYASSPDNWNRNVKTCLSELTGEKVTEEFQFRINS